MAQALRLPNELVLDASKEHDVSSLGHFVTVGISFSSDTGKEASYNGVDEIETVTVSRETTLSINAYGENAYAVIEKLITSLHFSTINTLLRRAGLSFMSAGQARSLPTAISGGLEQRAQVDIVLGHTHRASSTLDGGNDVEFKILKG